MSHVSSSLRLRSLCGTGACKVASSGFGRKLARRLSEEKYRSSIVRKIFGWEAVLYAPHDRYGFLLSAACGSRDIPSSYLSPRQVPALSPSLGLARARNRNIAMSVRVEDHQNASMEGRP
jgi:hypothetical protein